MKNHYSFRSGATGLFVGISIAFAIGATGNQQARYQIAVPSTAWGLFVLDNETQTVYAISQKQVDGKGDPNDWPWGYHRKFDLRAALANQWPPEAK
jgi:hypothetical protein